MLKLSALNFPPHLVLMIMECITTASYSLVLNGEPFGFFKGKKGLRQGDPLSPLLFTIAMEYFSRILHFTTANMKFRFHPLCGRLQLSHLMFVDDLLLFSRGDTQSVMVLLRSFATFSQSSGLHMNKLKSNIYFNGVPNTDRDHIISASGCVEGNIPFKYLGIPIVAGKMGKKDCQILVDKIVDRIRSFGARKLSYAGRLVMVQAVLTSLYTYWTSIFLIPKGVLRKIDSICRNYLWDGSCIYVRTPLVNWDQVCTPKKEGGLGLKNSFTWNTATMGKLVWWIYSKPDSLWVKWVHQIYMKGSEWVNHNPRTHMGGNWKTICSVRDVFSAGYSNGCWLADMRGYTVTSGYEWLRQKNQQVGWARLIWKSWMVPKHSFFCWLMLRKALNVKENCLGMVLLLMTSAAYVTMGRRISVIFFKIAGRRNWPAYKKNVCTLAFMAVYYSIWQQRNSARTDGVLLKPATLTTQILRLMQVHARVKLNMKNYEQELNWINALITI
ncbi:uncharacterized protein LOC141628769 [Silene latifolia]|uniref:uncharacterized protein LOC141628769 n=1 Tax=Silene latifolia TaxID=37657 RepID=UPI003D77F291